MPRKSNRPDWPQMNFAYWCEPIGEPPQVLFDKARQMDEFWNVLVACHDRFLERRDGKRGAERTAAYKEEWHPLVAWLEEHIAKKLGLGDKERQLILDRFDQTVSLAYKEPDAEMPSFKYGLKKINIPWCDRNGGKPVEFFIGDNPRRAVQLRTFGETRGSFRVSVYHQNDSEEWEPINTYIPLVVNCHRPLPAGALVKRVMLTGKLVRPFGWEWKLVFSIQRPPCEVEPTAGAVVGVDLGYRVLEDRVRFGMLYDGAKHYELALPLNLVSQRAARAGKTWDVRDVWEMESRLGLLVEACKEALLKVDRAHWPAKARASMSGIDKMRERGLFRLRRVLSRAGIAEPALEAFALEYDAIFRKVRFLETQMRATRNQLYRNLAIGLARSCAVIAWEGDLSLKELAENPGKKKGRRKAKAIETGEQQQLTTDDRIEKMAQKWRGYVGLSYLRRFLREAAAKTAVDLQGYEAAGTTNTCSICGGAISTGPDLILTCANGHRRDQDGNAARVLFSRVPAGCKEYAPPLDLSRMPAQAVRAIRPVDI